MKLYIDDMKTPSVLLLLLLRWYHAAMSRKATGFAVRPVILQKILAPNRWTSTRFWTALYMTRRAG